MEIEAGLTPILSKGVMIILRDLTEQRRLEQAVLHNERLKELGQMAATLAHEIRNPLGGIQGFASLLASDLKDLPAQQKMAKEIVEGASVLNQLVTNVLHYARPLDIHFEVVSVNQLIEECINWLKADSATTSPLQFLESPLV